MAKIISSPIFPMFKNLFDLSCKRTPLQAVGFYIAYLILLMAILVVLGIPIGLVLTAAGYEVDEIRGKGMLMGAVVALFVCVGLSIAIIRKKRLFSSFLAILLLLFSFIVASFGGGLLGLIPASILSAMSPRQKTNERCPLDVQSN